MFDGLLRSRIADVGTEPVRIVGQVTAGSQGVLVAPMTGRPCVAYALFLEHLTSAGWTTDFRYLGDAPFYVTDESGRARVQPSPHFFVWLRSLRRGSNYSLFGVEPLVPALAALLTAGGVATRDALGTPRAFHYAEYILAEADRVAIAGDARWEIAVDGVAGGYREPPRQLVLHGSSAAPLLISDDPQLLGSG